MDGTLIDSKADLANSVNAARAHMGLPPLKSDLVYSYVGNGAPVLIRKAMGPEASEAEVKEALNFFLGYYRDHMLDHTVLYPGVRVALDRLHHADVRMAVLTNKPVRFTKGLVMQLGLETHFFRVYGGNSFEEKKPDPVGIYALMGEAGAARERTLMVGDSYVDVLTARNAGAYCAGVTFGFQPDSLIEHPPDFLCDSMAEVVRHVLGYAANTVR
jgi:phosphoglycolate phosphatase